MKHLTRMYNLVNIKELLWPVLCRLETREIVSVRAWDLLICCKDHSKGKCNLKVKLKIKQEIAEMCSLNPKENT